MPRSITHFQEPLLDVELHSIGDRSKLGMGEVVYAVVRQEPGTTQYLVAAKARLAKAGLSIPHLELDAGHVATNLLTNVRNTLEGLPISNVYSWLDSTFALHWIEGVESLSSLSRTGDEDQSTVRCDVETYQLRRESSRLGQPWGISEWIHTLVERA